MKIIKNLILLLALVLGWGNFSFFGGKSLAQIDSNPANKLTEVEIKQESLRTTTQRVNNQLTFIIEEFERNGIGGEDLQVLKSLQSVLGQLSEKEMARIIALLQEAKVLDNPNVSQQRLLEAFAGQKSIMIKLKQLLDEFKRQKELYELSILFNRLAEKQNANLKEAVALEPILQGRTIDKLTEPQKVPLQVQATEQESIKAETLLGLEKLEKIAAEEFTKTTEQAINALNLVTNNNLKMALTEAIEDLRMARLYSAIGNEKRIRDTLRELARQLIPPAETTEALRQALRELENLIAEQKSVLKQTEDLKQNSRTLDNNKEIAARQLELSDRADTLRQMLKNTAPAVAENLKDSINKMQETHAVLNSNEGRWRAADAIGKEKDALKGLEKAKDELEKQVAAIEGEKAKPADPISQLKDLIGRVENLLGEQTNLTKSASDFERNNQIGSRGNELAQKQGEIKRATQEAQADSSPVSPKAAEELSKAAEQMGRAEKSLARGKNDPFSQNYAAESLKRAAQELKQALAEKEKAKEEVAAIDKALEKLSDVIKEQQDTGKETTLAAAKPQMTDPQKMKALAQKQAGTANKTSGLRSEIPQSVPAASQALSQAADNMREAAGALSQSKPSQAMPPQASALDNLYKAKDAMENRAAELKQQLGMPVASPQELAKAEELINQAQEQLNSALNELMPAGIIDELMKRQKELAGNIGKIKSQINKEGNKGSAEKNQKQSETGIPSGILDKAEKSAAEAAKKLASADVREAVNAMRESENALKEAGKSAKPQGQSSPQQSQATKPSQHSPATEPSQQSPAEKLSQQSSEASRGESSRGESLGNQNLGTGKGQSGENQAANSNGQSPSQGGKGSQADNNQSAAQQSVAGNNTGEKIPTIQELGEEQGEIRELAEQYLNMIEPSLNKALAKAAQNLNSASAVIGTLSATASGMPQGAREPLRKANSELMNATGKAAAQNPAGARQHAQSAQEALAKAEAALALATSGQPSQMAANQESGENQSGGQNRGQSNSNAQSGNPNTGQGKDGNVSGMGSSQQRAAGQMGRSQGTSGNWYGPGGDKGQRMFAEGAGKFIGLPQREREAIMQSQAEKYPPDYASFIEQYMKNLSDEAVPKK